MGAAHRVTVDEWRAEVERVLGRTSDDGMSVHEIAEQAARSTRTVREWLATLHRAGKLAVGQRAGTSIDGKPTRVPVYWLKKK